MQEVTWPGKLKVVTPGTTLHQPVLRQIYVGTAGDITVEDVDGTEVTFVGVLAGSTIGPFFVRRVLGSTTASNLVGFF